MKYGIYNTQTGFLIVVKDFEENEPRCSNTFVMPESYGFVNGKVDSVENPTCWIEGASLAEIDELKQVKITELKETCRRKLVATDWYYIRKSETGVEVPEQIAIARAAIRDECNDAILALDSSAEQMKPKK